MIPQELRKRRQWVDWRLEQRAGSAKPTKVPYCPDHPHTKASTTDSSTWSSYTKAKQAARANGFDGIGFVFTDDDPFCGIDFDDVVVDGEILPEAWEVIQGLDSYTEYSPSRTGVHVIVLAALRGSGKKTDNSPFGGGLEIYDRGRFFCVTGWQMPDTEARIGPADPAPILHAITNNGAGEESKSALGREISSRHDYLVHQAVELWKNGIDQDKAMPLLEAIARDIGLPNREPDELKRIVGWLWQPSSIDNRVKRRVEQFEVDHQARREFEKKRTGEHASLDEVMSGADLLKIPDQEQLYFIDPIWPVDANVLIVADRKAGKTTMVLNLFRSLLDGIPLFDTMEVSPPHSGTILYLNYEMVLDAIKNWLRKQEIKNVDDLLFWQLKGKRVRIWEEEVAQELSDFCQEQQVWCIVVDTQILSMRGLVSDENNAMEIADYQEALDYLKQISGVRSVVLVHHTNRAGKGEARGSSRIEDWPDAIWRLEKQSDGSRTLDLEMIRYYDSRDALPDKITLEFDRGNDRLSWDGSSKRERKAEESVRMALQSLIRFSDKFNRLPTKTELWRKSSIISGANKDKQELIQSLERQGLIREVEGERRGKTGPKPLYVEVTEEGKRVAGR